MQQELNTCRVCGLEKVLPEVETDIAVGVIVYWGDPICQDCAENENIETKGESDELPW